MSKYSLYRFYLIRFLTILILVVVLTVITVLSITHSSPNPLIYRYRLVRSLSVILSGIVIGFSASYLQGCLRNPLVDHYIIGIGSGALFATYFSLLLSQPAIYITSLSAVAGGLVALFITITTAEYLGGSDVAYVLVGIGVNALFSGLTILFSYMLIGKIPVQPLLMLTGSFINSSARNIPYLIGALMLVTTTYPLLAKPLNAIILGDTYAKQLGYNPRIYRLTSVLVAGSASSIIVSIFGLIGFIGLISPHISRLVLKTSDHRFVSLLSAIVSALVLLSTDCLSRVVLVKFIGEVPAGAIASVIGAPFFITLLISRFKAGRID